MEQVPEFSVGGDDVPEDNDDNMDNAEKVNNQHDKFQCECPESLCINSIYVTELALQV